MTVRSFNAGIDAFIDRDVPEAFLLFQRAIAGRAVRSLVLKSPVDKGRFRGGWFATVDSVTYEAPPEGESYPGAEEVINAALAVVDGAPPFSLIVAQNNVEYGEALEDGHSKQAPAGVLAVTVAELEMVR